MKTYFNCHCHTAIGSNIRLIDSINKPDSLIDKAIELGLSGIAITDHECLSAHVEAEKHMKKIQDKHPDFKLALGNEIYLTDDRSRGQKYYHFILIAKDAIGHKGLRELSSLAWMNSYADRRLERVPTVKKELQQIMPKYKGHIIATTACIGGELPQKALLYNAAKSVGDLENAKIYYQEIINFINFCQEVFGKEDFYIECAPGTSSDQVTANQVVRGIADYFRIKMVVGTDAHYLTKEDRPIHKAYLNSKDGDREVDDFYEFTYLMDYDEVASLLTFTFNGDLEFACQVVDNTMDIYNKITQYSLFHTQDIPTVKVDNYPKKVVPLNDCPTLTKLFASDDIQDRYWVNQCWDKLKELGLY